MIQHLLNKKYAVYVYLFHVVLGVLTAGDKFFVILWVYLVLAMDVKYFMGAGKNTNRFLNYIIVYISSFEILARMAGATPFIPYEFSKYLLAGLFLIGIFRKYASGHIGWLMVALLLPALTYDLSGEVNTENIIFNVMGGIDLGLGVIYFLGQSIPRFHLMNLFRLALFPMISVLSFAFFKTPDYDSIDFSLSANFDTTGGFGSNQVSTALGLGLFLMFILWLTEKKISGYRTLDVALIMGFIFQGLLTFSRGGMTGSGLAILTVILILSFAGTNLTEDNVISVPRIAVYIIPLVVIGIIAFQIADDITGNNLSLRYKGETAGTVAGSKEVDLNTITTNRYEIFLGDLELWSENVVLGTGVGASSSLRITDNEEVTAAHVELSRLLAEHGLLGLFFFLIILYLPYEIWTNNTNQIAKAVLFGLFILGLYTSFHAAMRTYITPLLISMSLLSVDETPTLRKKRKRSFLPLLKNIVK